MTTITTSMGVSGRYNLQVLKEGKVVRETGWFKNLITNYGLNSWRTTENFMSYCSVGTSSVTPQFTDVALGARVATSVGGPSMISSDFVGDYIKGRYSKTFAVGAATGNISEVGFGEFSNGTGLFSRALVLDINGLPTTITVLSDEQLIVYFEFWIRIPTDDAVVTIGSTTCTVRPAMTTTKRALGGYGNGRVTEGWCTHLALLAASAINQFGHRSYFSALYEGGIAARTSKPTGATFKSDDRISYVTYPYVANSYEQVITYAAGLGEANFPTGIGAAYFDIGCGFFQVGFEPKIPKTSVDSLVLTFKYTWGRDPNPPA